MIGYVVYGSDFKALVVNEGPRKFCIGGYGWYNKVSLTPRTPLNPPIALHPWVIPQDEMRARLETGEVTRVRGLAPWPVNLHLFVDAALPGTLYRTESHWTCNADLVTLASGEQARLLLRGSYDREPVIVAEGCDTLFFLREALCTPYP